MTPLVKLKLKVGQHFDSEFHFTANLSLDLGGQERHMILKSWPSPKIFFDAVLASDLLFRTHQDEINLKPYTHMKLSSGDAV